MEKEHCNEHLSLFLSTTPNRFDTILGFMSRSSYLIVKSVGVKQTTKAFKEFESSPGWSLYVFKYRWNWSSFCLHSQGGKSGAVQKCTACRGRGMRIMIRQLAPGMVQQMQSVCTDCNGEGKGLQSECTLTVTESMWRKGLLMDSLWSRRGDQWKGPLQKMWGQEGD